MTRIKWILVILAACMLFASCDRTTPGEQTSGTPAHDSVREDITTGPNQTVVEPRDFTYGRLSVDNRFAMVSKNDVRFTLNFDKKTVTPQDDIVVLVYVANYTGAPLEFGLSRPIVSRQQLIRASLTYGEGQYSVPVTVDYTPEDDLEGGKTELTVRDRKLLAATVTFHTSAFENVEESIFSEQYADTYQMKFWFGENEYDYFIETPLFYSEMDWTDVSLLQSLTFPESYVRLVGDVRFTVTFDRLNYSTDDDIRMHVKVENLGKSPINLYSDSDVSQPSYYIRAALSYGSQSVVRDDVASPTEIMGIESRHRLEYDTAIERDVIFYTSEFTNIIRSVYNRANRENCVLRVWLMVENDLCEIRVPITYSNYTEYNYHDREVPAITTPAMSTTPTEPEPTTEPIETTTPETSATTEPETTTTAASETTAEPAVTTGSEKTTLEPETTAEPAETTTPEKTTTAAPETTAEPAVTGGPEETTLEPQTAQEPAETTTPEETASAGSETTEDPVMEPSDSSAEETTDNT